MFTDLGWLNNFPKWLDVPFMVWINDGWRAFSAKYGLIFDAIGYALIRAYSITKNFLVDVPWPIIVIGVVLLTFFASGRKMGTTIFVGFCTFSIGFLNPRFWDKAIETTTIVFVGIVLCVMVGIPVGIAMARSPKDRNAILKEMALMLMDDVAYIPIGASGRFGYWWPWVKNYYGEAMSGGTSIGPYIEALWIDQKLKSDMGY